MKEKKQSQLIESIVRFITGHILKIGNYNCKSILMSEFCLDGGAMFGIVPKSLWSKKIPADEQNRIPMKSRSLLIQSDTKNILVDTGCGDKMNDKQKKIYGISEYQSQITDQFKENGIDKNDITDVILTHLHFDHCGGATVKIDNKFEPAYPNAVYHVHKDQWENALSPTIRERGSYFKNDFIPLIEHDVLNILNNDDSPFENIDLLISNGHTRGQLHPVIKGDNQSLFYCGDLVPTYAHIRETWHMGYDINPVVIIEEKIEILNKAIEQGWIMFFEHDPVYAAARLKFEGNGVDISEYIDL